MHKKFIFIILLFGLIAYGNSLLNSFVSDDDFLIVNNVFIKSFKNLPRLLDKSYITKSNDLFFKGHRIQDLGAGEISYRPVVTLTYFLDYAIWGLNPFGYHLTNLVIHLASAVLLYLFIFLILKDVIVAFFSGVIFSIHPINIEAVNVISYREDLLIVLFMLLSFIAFIYYKKQRYLKKIFLYYLSILFFGLALFSKEMALTLPVLIILYDFYFEFNGSIKKILANLKSRYFGFIVLIIIYLYVNFVLFANPEETKISYPGGSFYTNILTMAVVFSDYICSFWFPLNVKILPTYIVPVRTTFFTRDVILSISLIIAFIVLATVIYRKSKITSFFIFWFFVSLAPVSNIYPLTNPMAYRYVYLPGIGFCVVLAVLLKKAGDIRSFNKLIPHFHRLLLFFIIGLFITISISYNFFFKNYFTLAKEILRYFPNSPNGTSELAYEYYKKKDYIRAIVYFRSSLRYDTENPLIYNNLGSCYEALGRFDKAAEEFVKAIRLRPDFVSALYNLGVVYAKKNEYDTAISYFNKARQLDPGFVNTYISIAKLYLQQKKYKEANSILQKGLEIIPESSELQDLLIQVKKR
jgi:tetratricopeptide (TPR) repeat protein